MPIFLFCLLYIYQLLWARFCLNWFIFISGESRFWPSPSGFHSLKYNVNVKTRGIPINLVHFHPYGGLDMKCLYSEFQWIKKSVPFYRPNINAWILHFYLIITYISWNEQGSVKVFFFFTSLTPCTVSEPNEVEWNMPNTRPSDHSQATNWTELCLFRHPANTWRLLPLPHYARLPFGNSTRPD